MYRFHVKFGALLVGALALASAALQAQQPPRRMAPSNPAMPRYDVSTVASYSGTVTAIDTLASMMGMPGSGVHLTLKTATETLPVHLGPVMYLAQQKLRLAKGDVVEVRGSRIVLSTVPTRLAATVVRGADTLALRDAAGLPKWRGMRMGVGK